jgi:hypothetical protein
MIGVHDNLKTARRPYSLAVHRCAHILKPMKVASIGSFVVSLVVEIRPHLDECVVFRRLDGLEVVPGSESREVRKVPTGDSCTAALLGLFDHLVGVEQEVVGDDEAQSLRHLEIDD